MEIPDIHNYTYYKSREKYLGLNINHPKAHADYYENKDGSFSIGLYTFDGQKLFIAWGPKGSCSYHALLFVDPPIIGKECVNFILTDSSIIFTEDKKTYTYFIK